MMATDCLSMIVSRGAMVPSRDAMDPSSFAMIDFCSAMTSSCSWLVSSTLSDTTFYMVARRSLSSGVAMSCVAMSCKRRMTSSMSSLMPGSSSSGIASYSAWRSSSRGAAMLGQRLGVGRKGWLGETVTRG